MTYSILFKAIVPFLMTANTWNQPMSSQRSTDGFQDYYGPNSISKYPMEVLHLTSKVNYVHHFQAKLHFKYKGN